MLNETILAVDIGNTCSKFSVIDDGKILSKEHIPSKPELNLKDLNLLFNKLIDNNIFKAVVVSSVVPHNNDILRNFLKNKLLSPIIFLERGMNLVVKVKYGAGKAGMDIICKSAYLANKNKDLLCVDCGTATVINHVNKEGYLTKVGITVGYKGMYTALHNDTSLIPLYEPAKANKLLNDNTQDAVTSGSYFGYLGLLNMLVKKAKEETNCETVYFTGGFSFLFKDAVDFSYIYDPNLLLKGMYLIYIKNKVFFNKQ